MRYFFIMNPSSKGGKSQKLFHKIFSLLEEMGICYQYQITKSLEDAYELSLLANREGYDVIVAVGGDGTINRVLNGFYDRDGKRNSKAKLGILYTGTSPDFCKSYGIPLKMEEAVAALSTHRVRSIQIGKITFLEFFDKKMDGKTIKDLEENRKDAPLSTWYFACCANLGMGAKVARGANSGIRKILGDSLGTFIALLKALFTYRCCELDADVDGKRVTFKKVYNIFIGKTFYVASGLKVKNSLEEEDQRLYCLSVKNVHPFNLFSILKTLYGGKEVKNSEVMELRYGRSFEIAGNVINPEIEFDGDPAGFLPCRIETAKDTIELLCEVSYEQRERNDRVGQRHHAKIQ